MAPGSEGAPAERDRTVSVRSTVRGVLLLQAAANLIGALVVFGYLYWLFPIELPEGEESQTLNAAVFAGYLFGTLAVSTPLNGLAQRRALQWIREQRPPSPGERRATLSQPLLQTASAMCGWVGASIIFGLLNDDAARVSVGIVLSGLVTCSILYLMLERHFRPVFALALEGTELPENRREILPRLMLAWWLGSAIPLIAVAAAPLTSPDDVEARAAGWELSVLVVTCLVAGGLIMRAAAGSVAGPVNQVRRAMRAVEEGDLSVSLAVDNLGEIGRLEAGFNSMVQGLRERAELFDLLDQQVGPEVARRALEEKPTLGGGRRVVTVLFVDLHGYTAYSESHTPEEVVDMLNRFFEVVVAVVQAEGGHVNKFEGDAALCVFGAPDDQPDHAARALRAAARLPLAVARLLPDDPDAGVGVATGEAVAGYVGTEHRYEYTVIGDVVNVANRLCDLAKGRPGHVLAAAETVAAAGGDEPSIGRWSSAGVVTLRGRTTPIPVYEPPTAAPTGSS